MVLGCGCYADAIPPPGKMRWLRYPNWYGGMGLFNDHDAERILRRGWIVMNGHRARTFPDEPGCPHWIRMDFDEPWTEQHP